MLAHVRVEDHLDDEVAELAKVRLLHVGKHIAILLLNRSAEKKITRLDFFSEGNSWDSLLPARKFFFLLPFSQDEREAFFRDLPPSLSAPAEFGLRLEKNW